jgi:hypothetical protein
MRAAPVQVAAPPYRDTFSERGCALLTFGGGSAARVDLLRKMGLETLPFRAVDFAMDFDPTQSPLRSAPHRAEPSGHREPQTIV